MFDFDVVVIGAGPAGAIASALLNKKGYRIGVLEKEDFPRFVIGESLLPHCMEFIAEADMLDAVQAQAKDYFQPKNGAAFTWGEQYTEFDFADKFSDGPSTTLQVQRAMFDNILIEEAQKQGVEVRFGHRVIDVVFTQDKASLEIEDEHGKTYQLNCRFVLDASGYGRVLARLLDLEEPSILPERVAYFTHIDDHICDESFDRHKILISTHPLMRDVWLWTIPFANGRTSIGVVGLPERLNHQGATGAENILKKFVSEVPMLARILANADWHNEVPYRTLRNYSASVKTLSGPRFALLGNATEFLDPVFSSGVTIAMHSAQLAANLLDRQFKGETIDWACEYTEALMVGVNVFRTYVLGWYNTKFQDVIFSKEMNADIRRMICSILAGYAWDEENPYVKKPDRRFAALAEICGVAK